MRRRRRRNDRWQGLRKHPWLEVTCAIAGLVLISAAGFLYLTDTGSTRHGNGGGNTALSANPTLTASTTPGPGPSAPPAGTVAPSAGPASAAAVPTSGGGGAVAVRRSNGGPAPFAAALPPPSPVPVHPPPSTPPVARPTRRPTTPPVPTKTPSPKPTTSRTASPTVQPTDARPNPPAPGSGH